MSCLSRIKNYLELSFPYCSVRIRLTRVETGLNALAVGVISDSNVSMVFSDFCCEFRFSVAVIGYEIRVFCSVENRKWVMTNE